MQVPQTLEEKIAQLLFVRIGSNMPPAKRVDADEARILALIQQYPIGGLCLFNGLYPQASETLQKLQKACKYPLLVGTDMERGVGQQMRPATIFPHLMAFQAMGDEAEQEVENFARIGAREALRMGIHIAFAPVADVSRNPKNPIIATRAFSTDPAEASRLVRAFVRGCREEGLLSCAKHFPGHGNTDKDSHEEFPIVSSSRAEMEAFDFPPFQAAFEEGCELVMTAHLGYPALDAPHVPATASKPILVDVLRGDLGFKGTVITDSLLMAGIGGEDLPEAMRSANIIAAGADILLDVKDVPAIVEGIAEMVRNGSFPEARIDEALARIWALKTHFIERFGADFFVHPETYFPAVTIGDPAVQAEADAMARKAIAHFKADAHHYPLPNREVPVLAFLIKPFNTPLDPPEQPLAAALREALPHVRYEEITVDTDPAELDALLEVATSYRHVLLAPIVKPAAWHRFGLKDHHQAFVEALIRQQPVVMASLGSPQLFNMVPETAAHVCVWSDMACSQRALAADYAGV